MINIKLVSLKSDKKDLCKYIKSDSQLLILKITLDYLLSDLNCDGQFSRLTQYVSALIPL